MMSNVAVHYREGFRGTGTLELYPRLLDFFMHIIPLKLFSFRENISKRDCNVLIASSILLYSASNEIYFRLVLYFILSV